MLFENKDIKRIYIINAIDALAFSISGIFVPIFLLQSGARIRDIALYYIIHNIVLLLTALIVGLIAGKVGLKKTILLRYPFLFIFLGLLVYWRYSAGNIILLALVGGIQASLFWIPMNIFFGRHTKIRGLGQAIGKLNAIPQLASLGGPLLGGLIAAAFGFRALFAATFVISIFSLIPLFAAGEIKDHFKFQPRRGLAFFLDRPKILLADIMDNIGGEMEGIIWPIFVFLTVKNTVSVGFVGTLVALGSFVFTVVVGNLADKKKERDLIKMAVPFLLAIWLLRLYIRSSAMIYLVTLAAGFALTLLTLPYTRLIYSGAKRERNESFFIMKEVPTVAGRLIIFTLIYIFADHIVWLFPVAGASYLYFLFL